MKWTTTDEIVNELKLESASDDFEALKKELRLRMAGYHPDKTGGAFSSKQDEIKYKETAEAYEFVNQALRESRALIPVTQLPAIIKAVRDAQLGPPQSGISQLRSEYRAENRLAARSSYFLPKIGSGVFAGICAFLFTFSGTVAEHPLIGPIAKSITVQATLLVLAACAGVFFLITWRREKQQEAFVEWLLSEDGRLQIFGKLATCTDNRHIQSIPQRFTARTLIGIIMGQSMRLFPGPDSPISVGRFARQPISLSIAEKVAEIHILELEKRRAIHRVDDPSIDAVYEFDKKALVAFQESTSWLRGHGSSGNSGDMEFR